MRFTITRPLIRFTVGNDLVPKKCHNMCDKITQDITTLFRYYYNYYISQTYINISND